MPSRTTERCRGPVEAAEIAHFDAGRRGSRTPPPFRSVGRSKTPASAERPDGRTDPVNSREPRSGGVVGGGFRRIDPAASWRVAAFRVFSLDSCEAERVRTDFGSTWRRFGPRATVTAGARVALGTRRRFGRTQPARDLWLGAGYRSRSRFAEQRGKRAAWLWHSSQRNWTNGVGMVARIADDPSHSSSPSRRRFFRRRPSLHQPSPRAFPVRSFMSHRSDRVLPEKGLRSRGGVPRGPGGGTW